MTKAKRKCTEEAREEILKLRLSRSSREKNPIPKGVAENRDGGRVEPEEVVRRSR